MSINNVHSVMFQQGINNTKVDNYYISNVRHYDELKSTVLPQIDNEFPNSIQRIDISGTMDWNYCYLSKNNSIPYLNQDQLDGLQPWKIYGVNFSLFQDDSLFLSALDFQVLTNISSEIVLFHSNINLTNNDPVSIYFLNRVDGDDRNVNNSYIEFSIKNLTYDGSFFIQDTELFMELFPSHYSNLQYSIDLFNIILVDIDTFNSKFSLPSIDFYYSQQLFVNIIFENDYLESLDYSGVTS